MMAGAGHTPSTQSVAALGVAAVALFWATARAWHVARQREAMDTALRTDAREDDRT